MKSNDHHIDYCLDITDEVCPMTFVKTRLQIEKMTPGEVLEIRLKGAEPLKNVPESLAEIGHTVLATAPENGSDGIYRLLVLRN